MAIRDEIKSLKTDRTTLRKFGLVVGIVFLLIALWLAHRGNAAWWFCATAGAPLAILGLIWPSALRLAYIGWMSLAFVLGTIASTILLTILYFLVVTPTGLLARVAGKDFLRLRLDPQATSYWLIREQPPADKSRYEQQF